MDASTNCQTPPLGNADTIGASPHRRGDDPPQSPDRLPIAVVAKRGALSSPVRRSPRLSCLLPPPPPVGSQETQDLDESSDGGSWSVNDTALHLSRDGTPENDDLLPDEPSSVLATRIMRAHDNPSPPPQDLAHPGTNYMPGRDGQFPLTGVPPSAFRPINLLERLNQFSGSLFDPPRSPRTPTLGGRSDLSGSNIISQRGFISLESPLPFTTSLQMKGTPNEDIASVDTTLPSSTQCTVDDHLSRSSRHVCKPANLVDDAVIDASSQPIVELRGEPITVTSCLVSDPLSSPPTQAIDPSLNPAVPSASDDRPQRPLPRSERGQSVGKSSPLPPDVKTVSSLPSDEHGKALSSIETIVSCRQDSDGKEILPLDKTDLPFLKGEQESKYNTANPKEIGTKSLERPESSQSANAPAGPCLSSESTSSIPLPAEPIPIEHSSMSPPRTPAPSVPHPDFSRTSVRRPVIAPTPVRANSARKLNSPSKLSLEVDDIYRTPAQRVPIETGVTRGTSSFQRSAQLSTGSDQFRSGRFLTIRAPVFTRSALDNPSRSPAKRMPITDSLASPARGHQAQSSPTRLGLRARSTSAEPRPSGNTLARSRSVEPSSTISRLDNLGKIRESIFPTVPPLPRTGSKLPFPLVPSQKSSSDMPLPILEEHESVEIGNTEIGAALDKVLPGSAISQLRQPSTNSRIPRIGNQPYARPPKNGKPTVSTTTDNTTRAPRTPPFQLACKNGGVGNSNAGVPSIQPVNDQCLAGSLKRKRGAKATVPASSHPVMIRQVVPGILNEKYAPKPGKFPSQAHPPPELALPKAPQPLKFRKVVDGMLSARYAPAKPNLPQTKLSDPPPLPLSPLSDLSSLSDEGSSDEKQLRTTQPFVCLKGKTSDTPRTDTDAFVVEPNTRERHSLHQDVHGDKLPSRPRRTSRTRKPTQQQHVLGVFDDNTFSTRPPPARRKPQSLAEGVCFLGMSATALKALTASNTTKNQQTVAVLATEVIRKEGLRPESPTVKARTILQKQRDERDTRRRERAQKRAQLIEEDSGGRNNEGQGGLDDRASIGAHADNDENDYAIPHKHRRGPGDEEDYVTPERPERFIEPLILEGLDRKVKPVKQVKWHQGLSTVVYLDEIDPQPKSLPKNVVVRGCLAPTSKNLPLDPLGNLDLDNRPSPELITEHVVVKKYLYDNDIEPEPIPAKMTRSKGKKSRS